MASNYKEHVQGIDNRVGALFKAAPAAMGAYGELVQAVGANGALDAQTKELMAVAIAIVTRCEDCIVFHSRAAIKHGASREAFIETITVAVEMGGGPATVYGAKALQAYTDLSS